METAYSKTQRDGEIRIYSPTGESVIKITNYRIRCSKGELHGLLKMNDISLEKPPALIAEEKASRASRTSSTTSSSDSPTLEVENGTDN